MPLYTFSKLITSRNYEGCGGVSGGGGGGGKNKDFILLLV